MESEASVFYFRFEKDLLFFRFEEVNTSPDDKFQGILITTMDGENNAVYENLSDLLEDLSLFGLLLAIASAENKAG
jgi:hypothetical protein